MESLRVAHTCHPIAKPAHIRGGWFNKCQYLCELVIQHRWEEALQAVEVYYGGALIFVQQLANAPPVAAPLAVGANRSGVCIARS